MQIENVAVETSKKASKPSMHPRVLNGKTRFKKVNTCEKPRRVIKAASRLAVRVRDWEQTCRSVKDPRGYRKPGSMKS